MKYTIKNNGSREVAVQGVAILESIAPNTTRTIKTAGEIPQEKMALLRGRGCEIEKADDDAAITPFHHADAVPKPKVEPTDAEILKALQDTAEGLGIAFTDKTEADVLAERIAEEEKARAEAAEALADLREKATGLGVDGAADMDADALTAAIDAAEQAAKDAAEEAAKAEAEEAAKAEAAKDAKPAKKADTKAAK